MHCTTLIDGYNIIFTCGLYGKHATAESLAQARRRLLTEIGQRFGNQAERVTVVFDAQRPAHAAELDGAERTRPAAARVRPAPAPRQATGVGLRGRVRRPR